MKHDLVNSSADAVAMTAFHIAAASNPIIGSMYLAYQVAKFTYPVVQTGVSEYRKTGETSSAIKALVKETTIQTGSVTKNFTIGSVVGSAVDSVAGIMGVAIGDAARSFVRNAVSDTIEELIE